MANPNFVINGAYIAGGIMALTSIVVPSLLIPAVIVAAMPLLLTSFISEKKITRSFSVGALNMDSIDSDLIERWKAPLDEGDEFVFTSQDNPLTVLSTPFDMFSFPNPEVIPSSVSKTDFYISANWLGVGEAENETESLAVRKILHDPSSFKFIRVGRMLSRETPNPFRSPSDNPDIELETTTAILPPVSRDSEVVRCGDIVQLQSREGKYLTVAKENGLGYSSIPPGERGTFQVTILDDVGDVMYGTPLTCGRPFRIRSMYFPSFEVGLSAIGQDGRKVERTLAVYEWAFKAARGVVKTKGNKVFTVLDFCIVSNTQRSVTMPVEPVPLSVRLYRCVPSVPCPPDFEVTIIGWLDSLDRSSTLQANNFCLVFLCRQRIGSVYRTWVNSRTVVEFGQVLEVLEQVHFTNETASSGTDIVDPGFQQFVPKTLSHEKTPDQTCRAFRSRMDRLLIQNSDRTMRWFISRKGTVIPIRQVLLHYFSRPAISDSQFMVGGPDVLGVTITPTPAEPLLPIFVTNIARPIWDTFWIEEIIALFPGQVSFYPPRSKKAAYTIFARDILAVTKVAEEDSPLPGLFTMRIETLGRSHTIVFNTEANRAAAIQELSMQINPEGAMSLATQQKQQQQQQERPSTISQRLFQAGRSLGLQIASTAGLRIGAPDVDKFAFVSGQWLPTSRRILNSRKFRRDVYPRVFGPAPYSESSPSEPYWMLSVRLLKKAAELIPSVDDDGDGSLGARVSVAPTSSNGPSVSSATMQWDKFLALLDDTCYLKAVDLAAIDLTSAEAVCFFANVYHTLLLHARIVFGPPSQKDWQYFFSNSCYEIGGEVFSLAEIEQCVLRGKLSKPKPMTKQDPILVSGSEDHSSYALSGIDLRINFLLNSGSASNTPYIYMLTPLTLERQLMNASETTLKYTVSVDLSLRAVMLPKVCEIYRGDFGASTTDLLENCQRYLMGTQEGADLATITSGEAAKPPTVKFLQFIYESTTKLKLVVI